MLIVYILQSLTHTKRFYVGSTHDLPRRLCEHNAGESASTSRFKPWRLVVALHFESDAAATAFERYLKSGSGRAFAIRHFVPSPIPIPNPLI